MQERLNKILAQAGIASRRRADELIESGMVSVNGTIVTELGTKVDPETDNIKFDGKTINEKLVEREKVYILLNKPKGYLSSVADPEGRLLVTDLVPKKLGKLHPVGRLDFNTEGLLILTNDGAFTNLVASSKKIPKVYEVKVKGLPNANAINKLRRGITLDDGFKTAPAEIKDLKPTDNNAWYEVTLHEGHNQQIRKMFDAVGHSVVKLRRLSIGHVADDKIPIGAYRELTTREIREFLSPHTKKPKPATAATPLKKTKTAKADDKPVLKANSRAVTAKKPKNIKAKPVVNSKDAGKKAKPGSKNTSRFYDFAEKFESSDSKPSRFKKTGTDSKPSRFKKPESLTETTPSRFKKPGRPTSGLSKFKDAPPRKPKK
jgi:23S rRNA pseudouridine2605 synthase